QVRLAPGGPLGMVGPWNRRDGGEVRWGRGGGYGNGCGRDDDREYRAGERPQAFPLPRSSRRRPGPRTSDTVDAAKVRILAVPAICGSKGADLSWVPAFAGMSGVGVGAAMLPKATWPEPSQRPEPPRRRPQRPSRR